MFGFCAGGELKKKFLCNYICKRCGEIFHIDDVTKHLFADHPDYEQSSFEDALDEYDRSISFGSKKESMP